MVTASCLAAAYISSFSSRSCPTSQMTRPASLSVIRRTIGVGYTPIAMVNIKRREEMKVVMFITAGVLLPG